MKNSKAATITGVPIMAFITMLNIVAVLALVLNFWCWLLVLPSWFIMAKIAKNNDKAFHTLALWFETKWRNRNKKFLGASLHKKQDYRRKSGK